MPDRSRSQQRAHASRAFDFIADDYDTVYGQEGNAAMAWMRRESIKYLEALFPPGSRLLEVGCGTGDEAVALALSGRSVVATDLSPRMAQITAQKAARAQIADRVQVVALAAGALAALRPRARFDGAYASFGALNCEPDLRVFGEALYELVRPGGAVVCGVMGRVYLFEMLWYLAHGSLYRAFRRLRPGWQLAPVSGVGQREMHVPTRYLLRRDMRRLMGSGFDLDEVWALPLWMPPPYAASLYQRYPALVSQLEILERALRCKWPFSLLGDHLVMLFRRRP